MNKQNLKRYAISSGVTFLSTFLTVIGMGLSSESGNSLDIATISGIIITGARAGVKVVVEKLNNQLNK